VVFVSNLEEVINRQVRGRVVHLFGLSTSHVLKMEAKRDIDGLIRALAYKKDPVVRKCAAKALGEIGDARAVDGLVFGLKDQDEVVRRFAAEIGRASCRERV
jgi:HEAT repeat protein